VVQSATGHEPALPESLGTLMKKKKSAWLISPEYAKFRSTVVEILKNL
jgi:hypothetical protein